MTSAHSFLATSQQRKFVDLIRGNPGPLDPPVENMDDYWQPHERASVHAQLGGSIVGSPVTVRAQLHDFVARTGANEIMANAAIFFDHAERLRSYELLAQVVGLKPSF